MGDAFPKDVIVMVRGTEIIGLGLLSSASSLSDILWEGMLETSHLDHIYENRDEYVVAYVAGYYYKVVFTRLAPTSVCSNFTYLRGNLRSSKWHRLSGDERPQIKFPENETFLPLVNVNCFKNSRLDSMIRVISNSIEVSTDPQEVDAQSTYYPCVVGDVLGVCFNAYTLF